MAKQQINSAQIKNVPVRRNNSGSNITEVATVQTGWQSATLGSNSSAVGFTVTFPTAFATTPIVTASFAGDQASGTVALGNAGSNINGTVFTRVTNISTTGCLISIWAWNPSNTAVWSTGNITYVTWQAIGA
jgi:hypothetical protein